LRRRRSREKVGLLLDGDLGGRADAPALDCLCEVDHDLPGLLFRRQDDRHSCLKFRFGAGTEVHRGWQLDGPARAALEKGAFPRLVDLIVFTGCYNNSYDYYTSRLSGWSLVPPERQALLPEEAWGRTVVVSFAARQGARKQQDAERFLSRQARGMYDKLFVYAQGVIGDSSVSADAEYYAGTDEWRDALRQRFESTSPRLRAARASEVENLLQAPCHAVTRESISLEYSQCMTDFIFVTLTSRSRAETFCELLDAAAKESATPPALPSPLGPRRRASTGEGASQPQHKTSCREDAPCGTWPARATSLTPEVVAR